MSTESRTETEVGLVLVTVWAVVGVPIAAAATLVETTGMVAIVGLAAWEWMFVGLVGLLSFDDSGDMPEKYEQRPEEANVRYLLRLWVGIHVLIVTGSVKAVIGVPRAFWMVWQWAWKTPEEVSER